jgi:hypothetical protein
MAYTGAQAAARLNSSAVNEWCAYLAGAGRSMRVTHRQRVDAVIPHRQLVDAASYVISRYGPAILKR